VQPTENATLPNGSKNSPDEKPSTIAKETSKEIAARPTTMRLSRLVRPMDEYEAIQVEEYLLRHETLRRGVSDSMSIVDSSANVLNSQMQSLLTADDPDVRKPGEWATELAVQCGKGIAELIKAKTEVMRLLK
jgi:hypothetical protein